MEKTICAISTPIGVGGISIIRMSGEKSLEILRKVLKKTDFSPVPRKMYFENLCGENFSDQTVVFNPDSIALKYFCVVNTHIIFSKKVIISCRFSCFYRHLYQNALLSGGQFPTLRSRLLPAVPSELR